MLILDEATSSVDTMTELAIQRAFQEMMKNKTRLYNRTSSLND